jgi:hypothetical protein
MRGSTKSNYLYLRRRAHPYSRRRRQRKAPKWGFGTLLVVAGAQ